MASIVFTLDDGSSLVSPLDGDLLTIGRTEDSIVQLASPSVSSHHAIIKPREDGYYVQDLASRNGTRINGVEIEEALMNDGDRISFGDVQAIYYAADELPEPVYAEEPVAEVYHEVLPQAQPVPQSFETVAPLVRAAAPVAGVPRGVGRPAAPGSARRYKVNQGDGCLSSLLLVGLFVGAFFIGLCLRHYRVTEGGVLPNDLIERLFSKVKITVDGSPAK
jgi:FHA domain